MAIYLDDNGWWRDTEKEAAAEAARPGYYDDLIPAKKQERADTETFKALMQPAASAGPDAQAALVGILSDASKPKEARAGAAEALYPGVEASIGRSGELSFRAAPSSDLGFNYPNKTTKNAAGQAALGVSQGSELLSGLSESVKSLQSLTNTADIVNLAGQVAGDLTNYTAGKRNELKAATYATLGISDLENTLADWKNEDQKYYLQNTGGKNIGPSQETTIATQQLANAKQMAEGMMTEVLEQDPEYNAIMQQQKIFGMVLTAKTNQTMIEPSLLPEGTAEYMAMSNMTPVQVLEFSDMASKGDPRAVEAINRFNEPVLKNVMDIYSGTLTGTGLKEAETMAKAKIGEGADELLGQIGTIVNNFDNTLMPTLPKAIQDQIKGLDEQADPTNKKGANMLLKPADRKAAALQSRQLKVQFAIEEARNQRDANWKSQAGTWTPPEDPGLAESWQRATAIVDAKLKAEAANKPADKVGAGLDAQGLNTKKLAMEANYLEDILTAVLEDTASSNTPDRRKRGTEDYSKQVGKYNEQNAIMVERLAKYLGAKTATAPASNVLGGIRGFNDPATIKASLNSLAIKQMLRQTTLEVNPSAAFGYGSYFPTN